MAALLLMRVSAAAKEPSENYGLYVGGVRLEDGRFVHLVPVDTD